MDLLFRSQNVSKHVLTHYLRQVIYCCLYNVQHRRVLFEDPSFPADDVSLQIRYKSFSEPIEWKRPHVSIGWNTLSFDFDGFGVVEKN